MLQGFAANIIVLNGHRHKNALLRTDSGRLHSLLPLSAELPFTRFFDGLLLVLPAEAPAPTVTAGIRAASGDAAIASAEGGSANSDAAIAEGDAIAIWQLHPYDVLADCATALTRVKRVGP